MNSKWILPETPSAERIDNIVKASGATRLVAAVLAARNFSPEGAKEFLEKSSESFYNPFLFSGMKNAVSRIEAALLKNEKITVYGDYDADGITASVLLTDCLRKLGGTVFYYIPERENEGYGMSKSAIDVIASGGSSLIISVDCGITAVEECAYAKTLGIDVIITDHHECGEEIPSAAVAVIDPKTPGCEYPDKGLAGVGVALKLCQALMGKKESMKDVAYRYSEFVALGTIADIAPLTGENRVLCDMGLNKIPETENFGFRALLELADLVGKPVDSTKVGFQIAPKINAVGRLDDASHAVDMFLSDNEKDAINIARNLEECNHRRQEIEQEILAEAEKIVEKEYKDDLVLVLCDKRWHHGVVGIVASRLTKKYNKPCILISPGADGNYKGSGRSLAGFSLYDGLCASRETLVRFGGHELAAGLVIEKDKVDEFRKTINEYANKALKSEPLVPVLNADLELRGRHLNLDTARELLCLCPFGAGNDEPAFVIKNMTVQRVNTMGNNGQHLRLQLLKDGCLIDAVAFGFGGKTDISYGSTVTVMAHLEINSFRGVDSAQLRIMDIR